MILYPTYPFIFYWTILTAINNIICGYLWFNKTCLQGIPPTDFKSARSKHCRILVNVFFFIILMIIFINLQQLYLSRVISSCTCIKLVEKGTLHDSVPVAMVNNCYLLSPTTVIAHHQIVQLSYLYFDVWLSSTIGKLLKNLTFKAWPPSW